ncbi:netrin receptor UNC5C-like isoform X1 [Lates japonicus]|uniref:Netrin receptor UNC5C-like isoform X1 n=1 Tax=Lates japonicus TaxID=270547 RepID=A0AAD3ML11_LATJO|nr:netrin receptor UNC5C-like isoform X1 [Lates japonicus]
MGYGAQTDREGGRVPRSSPEMLTVSWWLLLFLLVDIGVAQDTEQGSLDIILSLPKREPHQIPSPLFSEPEVKCARKPELYHHSPSQWGSDVKLFRLQSGAE